MTGKEDLYLILEVARKASVNEIKRAFRKLARRYHPDINPGDRHAEDHFKRITEAYEVLSDPLKRQFYDVNGFYTEGVLEEHEADSSWGFSFQGFDFSGSSQSRFGEIFSHVFARQAMRREPERGQDLEYQVSIGFDDAIRGLRTGIVVFHQIACDACGGGGQARGAREFPCAVCNGAGKITKAKGHLQFAITCADCGGSGRAVPACQECGGEGRRGTSEAIQVQLPPGIDSGARIRMAGKGDAGRFGGPVGDLYVAVNVAPHPIFKRIGDNIHCTVPVTVSEAALGTKVEVPTIDGRSMVRVPPGTQTGQVFRLREKGTPSLLNPGVRGDQYVEVKVVIPRIADERSKEILRELARLNPEDPRKDLWR